ncbi:MAG TPA: hypothetical protein QF901_02475 [Gammaproteobacteria bacterium]|nr:hypothetical protein [Gammaproteobacteria bacterium]
MWLDGEPAPCGFASIHRDDGHIDSRIKGRLDGGGAFELGPAPSGEMLIRVRVDTEEGESLHKQSSIYIESGASAVVDFDLFSGMSSVSGEIHTEVAG